MLAPKAQLRALVVPQKTEPPDPPAPPAPPAECEVTCAHHRPVRLSWASLLKRVFAVDLEHCPNCGGELKIMAAILEAPVIEKILMHLGLQAGHRLAHQPVARRCRRPDPLDPSLFKRPGTAGRGIACVCASQDRGTGARSRG